MPQHTVFQLRLPRTEAAQLLRVPVVAEALARLRDEHLAELREAKRQHVAEHRLFVVQVCKSLMQAGWSMTRCAPLLGCSLSELSTLCSRYDAVGVNGLLPSKLRVGAVRRSRDTKSSTLVFNLVA